MENYVGKRLDGRYEIQDVIGVGGMAVVYKAYDNIDDRIVAVKVLKDEYLANEEFRRRFKNESKAIAVLSHNNIVKVLDVSFGDRLQYIVMEYIEGVTLKEYISKREVIDWNEALFFSIQILRALQHAHDKGIVHRDIKPQNIMLLEDGTIKVTDFGIARFSHGETKTMTEKAIGSVHYISPEQAKGELTDEKADIYSVGVVLYEMLTGKLPFEADSAVSVALMQVNKDPALPRTINPSIPLGFEQITMKAMQKNPRDRYQTAAEMLLDLEELKRNPNIKFDYLTYFVDDEPTRYVGKIQDGRRQNDSDYNTESRPKTVPPVKDVRAQLDNIPVQTIDSVQGVQTAKKLDTKTIAVISGIAVAVVLFIIILIVSMVKSGSITLGVGKKIEVMNFIGMNYEEEIKANSDIMKKYNFEISYEPFSDGKDGCVFKQDPEAGTEAPKGTTIRLYIAKSGDGQVIPDYQNQNYQTVIDELESMGFVVKVVPIEEEGVSVGLVVRTEPSSGSTVLAGSNVTVYYSASAGSGKLFKMPNVTGMTLEKATETLEKYGLTVSKTETVSSSQPKDEVLMQSPKNGSPVSKGESVILTVSSGKTTLNKSITLPYKVGKISVKVLVDDEVASIETVNTDESAQYVLKPSGDKEDAKIKVYLNDKLYYEATANFKGTTAVVSEENYHKVTFYVNVIGLNSAEAQSMLRNAGYHNIKIDLQESDEAPNTVIGQSPSQGSAPNLDTTATIVLTVSAPKSNNGDTTVPSESDTQVHV